MHLMKKLAWLKLKSTLQSQRKFHIFLLIMDFFFFFFWIYGAFMLY